MPDSAGFFVPIMFDIQEIISSSGSPCMEDNLGVIRKAEEFPRIEWVLFHPIHLKGVVPARGSEQIAQHRVSSIGVCARVYNKRFTVEM